MESKTWKYVENTFEASTRESRTKMNQVVVDHDAKLTAAAAEAGADPALGTLLAAWTLAKAAWSAAYSRWQNTRASYGGGTATLENLLNLLQTKPAPDQESKIETWDRRIQGEAAKGSPLYKTLLPSGRAPFSAGRRDNMINEVKNLATRLSEQTSKPALVALADEVKAFYIQLNTARMAQQGLEGDTDTDAGEIEAARRAIATALYGNLGMLMYIYRETPGRVAGFFDLDTLRQPASSKPAPPVPTPKP